MKNKYYKPEIEEFHIGFEYEAKQFLKTITYPSKNKITDQEHEWVKCKWSKFIGFKDVFNIVCEDGEVVDLSVPDAIRVKHLDREDIESLGLTVYELDMETHIAYYIKKGIKIICGWFPDDETENIEIGELFTIKNKSEFKRILRQIGVEVE
jgi:hypothetical protein